jgi:SH2 domain
MALNPQDLGPWFFSVNRTTAEAQLAAMGADSFLVRPSSVPHCFALSKFNQQSQTHQHFLISIAGDGSVRLQDSQKDHEVYQSLPELVQRSMELAGFAFPQGAQTHVANVAPVEDAKPGTSTRPVKVGTLRRRRGGASHAGGAGGATHQSVMGMFAPQEPQGHPQAQPQPQAQAPQAQPKRGGQGSWRGQPKTAGRPPPGRFGPKAGPGGGAVPKAKQGWGSPGGTGGGAGPGFLGQQRPQPKQAPGQNQKALQLQQLQQQEEAELKACTQRYVQDALEMTDALMELELQQCTEKWAQWKLEMSQTVEHKKLHG